MSAEDVAVLQSAEVQGDLRQFMCAESVIDWLKLKPNKVYETLCQNATKIADEQTDEAANECIMSQIAHCGGDNWYWDFMLALGEDSMNLALRNSFAPEFAAKYDVFRKEASTAQNGQPQELEQPVPEEAAAAVCVVARERKDYTLETLSNGFKPLPVVRDQLRAYQRELAFAGLKGKNDIICAPTGSGKTLVALEIIRQHLDKSLEDGKLRRVAFLVPTIPLVTQQCTYFHKRLRDKWIVTSTCGGESMTPKIETVLKCHLIVMTPQILVNVFGNANNSDRVKFSDFSLIIFDECHHAVSDHPYNVVMRQYIDLKTAGEAVPQVIGMTASLGAGKSKTDALTGAVEHIINMCANLSAEHLSSVTQNMDDLLEHVNMPQDELEQVACSHKEGAFAIIVGGLLDWLEDRLTPFLQFGVNCKFISQQEATIPGKKGATNSYFRYQPGYVAWYATLLKTRVPLFRDADVKLELMIGLEFIKTLYNAIELNALLPTSQALKYLHSKMTDLKDRQSGEEIEETMFNKYLAVFPDLESASKSDLREKAIVERLRSILADQYKKEPNCNTIVFVRTRVLAFEVSDFLNGAQGMAAVGLKEVRSGALTSVNAASEQSGMTLDNQNLALELFRSGRTKIMVATTVAEEGLDIATCSLIVKYNHVSNEIALVQRRGRGRAKGSRSVLLVQDGYIAAQEIDNLRKSLLEKKTLEYLRQQGEGWFNRKVEKQIQMLQEDRTAKSNITKMKRQHLAEKANVYTLLCRKCDAFVCRSTSVRRCGVASHFVVVEPSIWDRCKAEPHHHPKIWASMALAGKISCIQCMAEWGTIVKYCNVFLPTLKATTLVIQDEKGGRETGKQWKHIEDKFFIVENIQQKDKVVMYKRLKQIAHVMLDDIVKEAEKKNEIDHIKKEARKENVHREEEKRHKEMDKVEEFGDDI